MRKSKAFTLTEILLVLGIILVLSGLVYESAGVMGQTAARTWGGTTTINLPSGQHLVSADWYEDHIWTLTREGHIDEKSEVWHYKEHSKWGVIQGEVKLIEHDLPGR